jgi:hypothetical protein
MKPLLLLLVMLPLQTAKQTDIDESIIFHRMESMLLLRSVIVERVWPETAAPGFNIPFIYYTDSACFVANPTERFLRQYKCELKYKTKNIAIFKTPERLDGKAFHMEVNVSDKESDFDFQFPYGKMSGFEETRKYAPNLTVREWSGMVLHEFFHGYQFRHREFWQHASQTKLIYSVINDSLQKNYNTLDWYKQSVDLENGLILKAMEEKNKAERKKLILKMFALRDERRKLTLERTNRSVDFYESGFETMEGTARYIENAVIKLFSTVKFSDELLKIDSTYTSPLLKQKNVYGESGYKTEVSQSYTYAIGYNMARLLDVLRNNYKSRLFKNPELTLEKILREEIGKP